MASKKPKRFGPYEFDYDPDAQLSPNFKAPTDHLSPSDLRICSAACDLLCGLPSEQSLEQDVSQAVDRVTREQQWQPESREEIEKALIMAFS